MAGANGNRKPPEGRRFEKGKSGNPGGRPKGIASSARRILDEAAKEYIARVGDEGVQGGADILTRFWLNTMGDPSIDVRIRLHASEMLAERAYGKAPQFAPVESDDPLGLTEEKMNDAVEEFGAAVIRLAPSGDTGETAAGNGA